MNKAFIVFLLLALYSSQQLDKSTTTAVQEGARIPIDSISILPVQKRCAGICRSINMAFPSTSAMTKPYQSWIPSHGSPTVGNTYAWMWSAYNTGEGINYNGASFINGKNYCIEAVAQTTVRNSNSPNANARANLILTTSPVVGSVVGAGGAPIPATPSPNQILWNQTYTTLPNNPPSPYPRYIFNFTANNNYNNLWFFPSNPSVPVVELSIRELVICERDDPCDFKFKAYYKSACNFVTFYSTVGFPTGSSAHVQGYVWNFGDGNYSNEANPQHFYSTGGTYGVSLTVLTLTRDGKCCTKTYWFKVNVRECKPCDLIRYNNIQISNMGSVTKYEPTIPHNNLFIYSWQFSDGTTYSTRDVFKTNALAWVQLSIWYIGTNTDCCKYSVKRYLYIKKDPIRDIVGLSLTKQSNLVFNDSPSDDELVARVAALSKEDAIGYDEVSILPETDAPVDQTGATTSATDTKTTTP
jgi:hypothetical protein